MLVIILYQSGVFRKPCQTYKMEHFTKIVNGLLGYLAAKFEPLSRGQPSQIDVNHRLISCFDLKVT